MHLFQVVRIVLVKIRKFSSPDWRVLGPGHPRAVIFLLFQALVGLWPEILDLEDLNK